MRELIELGLDLGSVEAVVHGTTIGLNAIIQRSGARVSFVTSRGYRALLGIARARLPESFDLHASAEVPLVPRERVLEIDARLSSDGRLLRRPTEAELDQLVTELRETAPEAVALSLVEGFTAPEVEHGLAAEIAARLDGVPVVSAAGTWPEIREYERSLVAVLEAHIQPLMGRYYGRLRSRLQELGLTAPLFISASNGGALTVEYATEHPLETVLSGPASGVTAAASLLPDRNVLTVDMGGTSSDMSVVVDGSPVLTTRTMIGRLPLMLPVVDVNAIGSGGGSMITAGDPGDATALRIGPRSAGAVPGPVAYGLGGTVPTITDAYLGAGILNPDEFLGGTIRLDRPAAEAALTAVAHEAGLVSGAEDPDIAGAAAEYVLDVATVQMATTLRTLLAERGHEPGEFTLVPFGGAGPVHALLLAEELGIDEVIVPAAAATFCAFGAAVAPLRRDRPPGASGAISTPAWSIRPPASSRSCVRRAWRGCASAPDPPNGPSSISPPICVITARPTSSRWSSPIRAPTPHSLSCPRCRPSVTPSIASTSVCTVSGTRRPLSNWAPSASLCSPPPPRRWSPSRRPRPVLGNIRRHGTVC